MKRIGSLLKNQICARNNKKCTYRFEYFSKSQKFAL